MVYGDDIKGAASLRGSNALSGAAIGEAIGARAGRPQATIPGLIAQAAELQKFAADRAMSVDGLAGRAIDLATRLTGSFPVSGPDDRLPAPGDRGEPASALDAVQHTMGEIGRPLSAMDSSFGRLAAALEAIERALR